MPGARAPLPDRAAAVRRVFLGLLAANVAVVAAKVVIGISAGSLSVLGDAIHSSVDALNNVLFIALMGVASAEPDEEHPYGHTKFEPVGALGILVFLSVSCFELLRNAIAGLVRNAPSPQLSNVEIALLAGTLLINIWVAWYENRRGKALDSTLLVADATHTRTDVIITIGVLTGVILSRLGVPRMDPIIAIVVTMLVAHAGWEIVRGSLPSLVDEAARESGAIQRSAEGVDGVSSAYAIRSRKAAGVAFAELTIGVTGALTVDQAHTIADRVESQLKHELHLDNVTVHIEPC